MYHLSVAIYHNIHVSIAVASGCLILGPYMYDNFVSLLILSKWHNHRIAAHNKQPNSRSAPGDTAADNANANTSIKSWHRYQCVQCQDNQSTRDFSIHAIGDVLGCGKGTQSTQMTVQYLGIWL